MNDVVETYKDRSLLTLLGLLFIAFGIFTVIRFQSFEVPSFQAFLDIMFSGDKKLINEMMLTFTTNLFAAVGLASIGFAWIWNVLKEFSYNSMLTNITSILTGLAITVFSLIFIDYLFSKILVLLLVGVIGAMYVSQKN